LLLSAAGGCGSCRSGDSAALSFGVATRRIKVRFGLPMPTVRHGFVFLGGVSSGRWCGCVEGGSDFYGGFLDYAGGVCIRKEY
jgi:hypothetical protein